MSLYVQVAIDLLQSLAILGLAKASINHSLSISLLASIELDRDE